MARGDDRFTMPRRVRSPLQALEATIQNFECEVPGCGVNAPDLLGTAGTAEKLLRSALSEISEWLVRSPLIER